MSEDDKLNGFTPEEEKHVSFANMVYIGDGMTDIPCSSRLVATAVMY